ncbi:MAG: rhodanese-like domain-containing protein [Ketobacter sp.]|nr:rhodanese-like domain-containing protein [Ketobacter sp.]
MNTMLSKILTAGLFFLLASVAGAEYQGELTQKQAQERMTAGTITTIDVRSAGEYSNGHVPGAINIPHDKISNQLEQIKHLKDKPVLLYCRSGRRADMAETTLSELGFSQLYHLQGDMMEWDKNQLPVEK